MTSTSHTPGSIEATAELLRSELPELESHQQTLQKELASVTERLESVRTALGALQALSAPQADAEVSPAAVPPQAVAPEPETVTTDTEPSEPVAAATVGTPGATPTPLPVHDKAARATRTERAAKPTKTTTGSARSAGTEEKAEAGSGASAEPKRRTAKKSSPKTASARTTKAGQTAQATGKKKKEEEGTTEQAGGLTDQILAILAASGSTPVRARDVAAQLGRDGTPGSINAVRSTLDRLVGTSRAHRAGRGLYQATAG